MGLEKYKLEWFSARRKMKIHLHKYEIWYVGIYKNLDN